MQRLSWGRDQAFLEVLTQAPGQCKHCRASTSRKVDICSGLSQVGHMELVCLCNSNRRIPGCSPNCNVACREATL